MWPSQSTGFMTSKPETVSSGKAAQPETTKAPPSWEIERWPVTPAPITTSVNRQADNQH